MRFEDDALRRLDLIASRDRLRSVVDLDGNGVEGLLPDGRKVLVFASNDYLGLTRHPEVGRAAKEAIDRWGTGSGSARLIVGSRPVHSELERALAAWKGSEAALLFPTGYAANLGALSVFGTEGTNILSDELNHASIVDGCRLAKGAVRVLPHNRLDAVADALRSGTPSLVVTDSIFSMDGDAAPVQDLARLCDDGDALLITDEAHDVFGVTSLTHSGLRIGTLSKFLGAAGGFVAGPAALIDLLRNEARSFIFTTAAPPADAAAALASLRIFTSDEGAASRARLRTLVDRLAPGHPSPIISYVMGEESSALEASRRLLDSGFLVPAIRPPSVPAGSSRLRVTISALHREEHLDRLAEALAGLGASLLQHA